MGIFDLTMRSTVSIAVPPSRAWEVFADVRRWTEWSRVTLRSDVDEGFAWGEGQALHLRLRMAGVGVPFNVHITESDFPPLPLGERVGVRGKAGPPGPATAFPHRIAWASTKLTVTAVRTFTFEDDTSFEDECGGTLVTDEKVFTSPVLPVRLFYPRPIIRRMTESFLADLKAECERTN